MSDPNLLHGISPMDETGAKPRIDVDVLCVGLTCFDITMMVERHPEPDEKCFIEEMVTCGGGPAANAAVTVARLGGTAAFAGYLGNDVYGCLHMGELHEAGVNTRLVVRGSHPTPLSVILAKPDGLRTVVTHKSGTPLLSPCQVDFSTCRPKVILFDGHEPLVSTPLARSAAQRGILTVLDAGSVYRGTMELASVVHCLAASEKFARDCTGERDAQRAVDRLAERAPLAIVTLGERGLVWKGPLGGGRMPAPTVNAIDTTGAGDTFHGALALGLARGNELEDILQRACAAAALCCTKAGARIGIPFDREVTAFLEAGRARGDR